MKELTAWISTMCESVRFVLLLHVKMLEVRYPRTSVIIRLVDLLRRSELATLSYEDIILRNPRRKTFSSGTVGKVEAGFYEEHQIIERGLEAAIAKVRAAISALVVGDRVAAGMALIGVVEDVDPLITSTRKLAEMPQGVFAQFRKYLSGVRGCKGPSGAFSGRVPTLEILLRGMLPEEYRQYIKTNWKYFPSIDLPGIEAALAVHDAGHSLQVLVTPGSDLDKIVECLLSVFDQFRLEHYRAVARQVPGALTGEISGTGGETNPGQFLRERIKTLRR